MRLVTKSEKVKERLSAEFREKGVSFEVKTHAGSESFIGYVIEGTLDGIKAAIEKMEGVDRDRLVEGYTSFKESVEHVVEHLKGGENVEALLSEGPWVGEVLDQLMRASVIEYSDGTVRLKDGADVEGVKFQFKFPYDLVENPEAVEKAAKQFVFTDLTMEYEFDIGELDMGRINEAVTIAGKYFEEGPLLRVYFGLISRAIVARELLKALGNGRVEAERFVKLFTGALPVEIPTEKGSLVINSSREFIWELLRLLERRGYVRIKGGTIRKLRDID
ncbi:hypothetical protein [Thermococcus sp.]|uniref:hypothetical protein n=1 Tax=Thermococcus sp. TaxID=35749 RepID=UPI0026230EFC|nr:hypothetical protein [Thermococcus sp.]